MAQCDDNQRFAPKRTREVSVRGQTISFAAAVAMVTGGLLATGSTVRADPQSLAYGQHLSQECTTCHRRDGVETRGIPAIVGKEVDYFVTTMKFYQSGARDNPAMVSVAKALNDEQLRALAIYFGSLKPAPAAPAKKSKK